MLHALQGWLRAAFAAENCLFFNLSALNRLAGRTVALPFMPDLAERALTELARDPRPLLPGLPWPPSDYCDVPAAVDQLMAKGQLPVSHDCCDRFGRCFVLQHLFAAGDDRIKQLEQKEKGDGKGSMSLSAGEDFSSPDYNSGVWCAISLCAACAHAATARSSCSVAHSSRLVCVGRRAAGAGSLSDQARVAGRRVGPGCSRRPHGLPGQPRTAHRGAAAIAQ